MVFTVSVSELQQLIGAKYADPHNILGMHEYKHKNKDVLVVRVFMPLAKSITVIDAKKETFTWEMDLIHADGFFEVIIPTRKKWFLYKLQILNHDGTEWTTYDPYSFEPTISDLDRHLFAEGTHYKIFDKLGAQKTVVNDVEGYSFAVWAPNATRVSVIGNFNNWDGRRHQMRLLDHSGIWELFIPGLSQFDQYKYEIRTVFETIIEKSDPYGHFHELRPSKSSLLYDINEYKWKDTKWMEKRAANNPLDAPMNIYELHFGSWKTHEDGSFLTYLEMADELIPYVKDMGYTHIELMPLTEYPFDGSWGYQVTGYYAPTSRYGNPSDLMKFIDLCHKNDIGVIMDWVPAHFPKDAHGLARFDGTAVYEHEDARQGEHPDWGTLIYNYGRNEVKNFLIGNAIFWLEKYHIDGLRVDAVASMLYLNYGKQDGQWIPNKYGGHENLDAVEFLKHMNSIILKNEPNVLMIAEESTAWKGVSHTVEDGGLGFNLKWNMGWMNDFLSYMEKDPIYRRYHQNNLTFGMVYAYTENFVLVLSHDEVVHGKKSLLNKMPGDLWQKFANLRVAYGFMYGHPGKKLVFMGGEFGQFIEWNEKQELDWFLLEYDHHQQMQNYVKALNKLYKNEKAFWYDDFKGEGFEWINCDDADRSIVSFIRKTDNPKENLYFVCNFTPNPIMDFSMGVPFAGEYKEIFSSDSRDFGGSGIVNTHTLKTVEDECDKQPYKINLFVPPLGVAIFKQVK